MDYKELFIAIGLMILFTILYFLGRKLIFWMIEHEDKMLKKMGCLGKDKEAKKIDSEMPLFYLTFLYIIMMLLASLYIYKLIKFG